ncbi:SDR family oxidoreductase [Conexibacter sp. JD483]|uniref:SDR family NAD(P)-dependent oxidoreductase n=1 Tax=unclassified Conexibacter TaxID=2627773 RepID=UPI0027242A44|nr:MULTISPECIES: SDR family oxidoreductase [unclassified Conexibacter]MDO8189419.1 SDR family oxidoreductase [Conexibacter sp. CPCC 205706]MDO8200769.1 SDR family oxidoreductase [Conexibacter sp. CPCC 205762]MDR9372532.1 SDR family oxidoreductase [Conexibacter sp. JD483]
MSEHRPRPLLVTGAGGGIGAAVVELLTAAGHPVAVADRDLAAARAVADALPAGRPPALALDLDVTDLDSVRAGVADAARALGGLGGVVNNAGWLEPRALAETDDELLRTTLAVNLEGPLRVIREALPELIRFGSGRIVNVASDGALSGMTHIAAYAAAKGGVISLTRALTLELARHQITVNTVSPGPTQTPLFAATGGNDEQAVERFVRSIPLRRIGAPQDVATAIAFFCGEQAGFISGQILSVSGGLTRP